MKFSNANAKLRRLYDVELLEQYLRDNRKVYSFDLLSGHSCAFAKQCLSKVIVDKGKRKIQDGKHCEFRCFSASQEVVFPLTYNLRKANFDAMRRRNSAVEMSDAILTAMPKDLGICRIHVGGDFFNRLYFRAWQYVAICRPDQLFYAYTKSLQFWLDDLEMLPPNLILTASRGGRSDHLIDEHGLRESRVVFSLEEADELGLEIDHDDSHAAIPELASQSFGLLIHGQQPTGSKASTAIKKLKAANVDFSYSSKALSA